MLLQRQGLTIERPSRATGMAMGSAVAGLALVIAIALLVRALGWPVSFPQFLAYAGAAIMALVAVAFGFWTWACATMEYRIDQHGIAVRWGPYRQLIGFSELRALTRGRGEQRPRVEGIGWLGYHVGRGEVEGYERVIFYSTHRQPEDIVYVTTSVGTYALSPQDPARFISEVQRMHTAAGTDEAPIPPLIERDFLASHPIWTDRTAQLLVLAAVGLNVALWGYIFATYPDLHNEITIEFPPVGDIATLQSREEILQIPGTATAMLAANLLAAFVFQWKERAATYLVLSGTVFFQAVFWVAAIVAVVNA